MKRGVLRDIKGTECMVCSVSQTQPPHLGLPRGDTAVNHPGKRTTVGWWGVVWEYLPEGSQGILGKNH